MLGTALYYPHIDIRDSSWLKSAVLFWDEVQTIVPTSISSPYSEKDTQICEQEGYLRPLRCDLHQDVLNELGERVSKLLESPEWIRSMRYGTSPDPSQDAFIHADKLADKLRSQVAAMADMHPEDLPFALRTFLVQQGGLEMIAAGKLHPNLRRMARELNRYSIHPDKMSYELRHRIMGKHQYHHEGDWILVNGRFAELYMSALAALLARQLQVSPLTNEEPSAGVNLRCLVEDVAASGPTAAKGALVAIVMEGLRVDPETPIERLLAFRRGRREQLAELSGVFDDLKETIEHSPTSEELENAARTLFENKIRPGLQKLKEELQSQSIQSVWEGIQRAVTIAVPAGGMLATITQVSGFMLLTAGAFITIADVGIKSYLSRSRARASSPYTYLLDIERKFSLP